MIYKFDENNKILKLMYSRAKSRPSVYENVYVLNAPHSQLEPQEISTFELNYTMGWNKNVYINSSLFYNNLDNLISRENQIDSITRAVKIDASNGNKMETYGAEFQIIYKAASDLNIDASMSYQITKNKRLDIPGAYSPPLLLNLKIAYNLNENMIVAVNSYFVDKMESEYDTAPIDPVNGNYTSKGRIFQTTPSYINLGANFRYNNLFDSNMYLAIHCSNLLDNEIHYAPTLVNRAYLPKGTIGYGRAINATIGVNF
jgi:outer membrane receptor for ferrienterochelin and colicin